MPIAGPDMPIAGPDMPIAPLDLSSPAPVMPFGLDQGTSFLIENMLPNHAPDMPTSAPVMSYGLDQGTSFAFEHASFLPTSTSNMQVHTHTIDMLTLDTGTTYDVAL